MTTTLMAPDMLWKILGYEPFDAQKSIHKVIQFPRPKVTTSGRRYPKYISNNTGRQFGKTTVAVALASEAVITPWGDGKPPVVKVTADTEGHARKVWDKFVEIWTTTPELSALIKSYRKEDELITLHTNATIQMISANNPQAMAGDTVTTWIIDEAQYFSLEAWVNLLPSTTVRGGYVIMFGVSQGDGPFREACWRGLRENREDYPLYFRMKFTSYDNPYQDREEIDANKQDITDDEFRQLYLAEWVEESSKAFAKVDGIIDARLLPRVIADKGWAIIREPIPGRTYRAGLDVAWTRDYTVHTIWQQDGTLAAYQRFNRKPMQETMDLIGGLNKMYHNPLTATDTNGFGGKIYEDALRAATINITPVPVMSNKAKAAIVTALAVRIEKKKMRIPNIQFMRQELNRYEKKMSKANGKDLIRYGAPSGQNDDFVISAGLAATILPKEAPKEDLTERQRREQGSRARQQAIWEQIGA